MSTREKVVLGILGTGLVIMVSAGVLAFRESGRLLESRRLAEKEFQQMKLLDHFSVHLRDMRREGLNYVLLGKESYAENFRNMVGVLGGVMEEVRARSADLGTEEEIAKLLKDADDYIAEWGQIVATRENTGYEAAVARFGELAQSAKFGDIIDEIRIIQERNALAYTGRNSAIVEGVTRGVLAIAVSIATAAVLIIFASIIIVGYYAKIRDLLALTEEQKNNIEAKNSELESIISIVSHDLRGPLLNIKGFTSEIDKAREALREVMERVSAPGDARAAIDEALSESMPEALGFIRKGTESMHRLIENLVKVARAGQLPVKPERVDMDELVKGVLADLEFKMQQAGAKVKAGPLPECVADAGQVRQIFSNIIDNAIKYREASRPLEVSISGEVRNGKAVYCIEDNGVGIAAKNLGKIFDMYHRITKNGTTGEGIGLAVVKKMVERNGGRVEVESEPNRGSRFFIYLRAVEKKAAISGSK
jgi:signal transduction histidine kinase